MATAWLTFLLFAALKSNSAQPLPAPKWPHSFGFPQSDDYEVLPYPSAMKPTFTWNKQTGMFQSGKPFSAFIGILGGDPTYFSIKLPQQGCSHVEKTSQTAQVYKCLYATNGGYFGVSTGVCIGNLITDGKVIQIQGDQRANFAMTKDSFVFGYLTNATIKSGQFSFSQMIQGAGWLVRNGTSFINESKLIESLSDHFVGFEAPRTALGVFKNGSVILAEFDGSEVLKQGASLYDLADWMVERGVYQAINLDGGGSSVSVYNGEVISRPTCMDTPFVCERAVTSITCVSQLP